MALLSSFPFVLSVPDLNSSQAPLQPFGLRLTVRPASSLFHPPLCHSFVLPRPLLSARSASVSLPPAISLSRNRDSATLIHERTRVDRGAIGVKLQRGTDKKRKKEKERERTRQTRNERKRKIWRERERDRETSASGRKCSGANVHSQAATAALSSFSSFSFSFISARRPFPSVLFLLHESPLIRASSSSSSSLPLPSSSSSSCRRPRRQLRRRRRRPAA